MAHTRNEEFALYTGFTANGDECFAAADHLKDLQYPIRHLHYGDPGQHEELLANLTTWFTVRGDTVDLKFPFVIYVEVHEDVGTLDRIAKAVVGVEAIKAVDWPALITFKGQ